MTMTMTDADKIAFAVALVVVLVAAAFALGIFFRRLTDVGRPMLLKSSAAIGPIGFVHFRSR
jgi:uncharacterized membrane protein YhaH (DUF805 family)